MAILAVDEVWLREPRLLVPGMQPLGPVRIDWSHALTRDLAFYLTGLDNRELVRGGTVTWTNGLVSPVAGRGLAIQGNTGASTGTVPFVSRATSPDFTVAFWCYIAATPDADDLLFELSANINSNAGAFHVNTRPSGRESTIELSVKGATAVYNVAAVTRGAEGSWHHYVWGMDARGAFDPFVLVDGAIASVTKQVESIVADANVISSTTVYLCSRANSSLYSGAAIQQLGIWNRKLSLGEARDLALNSTQFLIPA